MPLQGSGSISISELATEFGGTAPHSLSEYYKSAGLVPSQRAITGSESYTSLVTGDQIASTGIYVNGVTTTNNTSTPTYTPQTASDGSGDNEYKSTSSENSSATFETAATTITIPQGEYVSLTFKGYHRYYNSVINGTTYRVYTAFWGDKDGSGAKRDIGLTFALNVDTETTGLQLLYEVTSGSSSDFVFTGATSMDLSATNRTNYSEDSSRTGWNSRPALRNDTQNTALTNMTIKGYASSATTIKVVAAMLTSDNYNSVHLNGVATGTDPRHGGTYDIVTEDSTLDVNTFKAYNNNSYALSVNGTNIPANTLSANAVIFSDNLMSPSVTASVTGNQPLNADVPTSGEISLTDFYSSEDE